jgi:hypothetical protein
MKKVHETHEGELVEQVSGTFKWMGQARATIRQRAWKARTHLGLRECPECSTLVHGIPARLLHEVFHDNLIGIFGDLIDRVSLLEEEVEQLTSALMEQGRFITDFKDKNGIDD